MRTARGEGGATLIEVMVSMVLVIVGLLGVYAAYTSSTRATSHGHRATQATARAERQLEMLRNAPTAAIKCLAAGGTGAACVGACCAALGDGGMTCMPASDGGVAAAICTLTPAPDTDPAGITYTYGEPTVRPDLNLPYLYDVQVQVSYTLAGELLGGSDTRTTVLRSALYKP